MKFKRNLVTATIVLLLFLCNTSFAQTAEVTRSGNTWTATVSGSSVYSGTSMGDAVRRAAERAGAGGTINVRNSGDLAGRINPRANQTFDFHENEVTGRNFDGFQANRVNGITVRNFHLRDGARSFSFHGCSDIHLHNIVLLLRNGNGVRVDNDRSRPTRTTNLRVTGGIRIEGARGHAFETYTVDGIEIDRIIARNNGYCGLILNDSRNADIGYIYAYRSPASGGYAGFRTANRNGPDINVDTLITVDCGRGYFSVSRSRGTTINYVNITGSTTHGMLIQNSDAVHIRGGYIWNNNCSEAIRFSYDAGSSGGVMPNTNHTIENVRVFDNRGANRRQTYGVLERGTDYTTIRNSDFRNAGSSRRNDIVLEGSNSVSIGNRLTGDDPLLPDDPTIIIGPPPPPPVVSVGNGVNFDSLVVYDAENGGNWNIMTNISNGQTVFGDRDFTFASIPNALEGSEWIQTAMNTRTNSSVDAYSNLQIVNDGYLYIAHSSRVEEKPDWLSEFELTALEITVQESEEVVRTLNLYRKSVASGDKIDLGINSNDGTAYSLMYLAIITDSELTSVSYANSDEIYNEALDIYPNPFNPIANISFAMPNNGVAEVSVYNINGSMVENLTKAEYQKGWHTISFNGSNLPSGIYFVRFSSGNNLIQKKMVLLK